MVFITRYRWWFLSAALLVFIGAMAYGLIADAASMDVSFQVFLALGVVFLLANGLFWLGEMYGRRPSASGELRSRMEDGHGLTKVWINAVFALYGLVLLGMTSLLIFVTVVYEVASVPS